MNVQSHTVSADAFHSVRIVAVGQVAQRQAEAVCDFNGLGWDEPGVVTGRVMRYIDNVPLAPGALFRLSDFDGMPGCHAVLVRERGGVADFRVLPDTWRPYVDWTLVAGACPA